jgi:hypothetical protein
MPERGTLQAYLFGVGRKRAAEWWRNSESADSNILEEGTECKAETASLEPMDLKPATWEKSRPAQSSWWGKGRESIRIPRFAFVSMLAAIVLLSGGLVMVRARANAGGPVLWLAAKLPP